MSVAVRVHLLLVAVLASLIWVSTAAPSDSPMVKTTSGLLHGIRVQLKDGVVNQFLGVRYGQPPVGPLRFKPALPVIADTLVDAGQFQASCMQPPHLRDVIYLPLHTNLNDSFISEDCLNLNVYVPDNNRHSKKPMAVMVWIPGEGFSFGYANQYDGSYLANHGNVIVVTVNYRLSVFGFLSTADTEAPGNLGLMDQLLALQWIKTNIGRFGGDPERLTVFGRLTGSISISALMSSPYIVHSGKPLFRRAIMQSSVAHENWVFESNPLDQARSMAQLVNCSHVATPSSSTADLIQCLQQVPASALLENSFYVPTAWRLVSGTDFLPEWPLKSKLPAIDTLVGTTGHEGSLCFLTHLVMKTAYTDKLRNDTLTQTDLSLMISGQLDEYFGSDVDPELKATVTEMYSCQSGSGVSCRMQFLDFCGDLFSDSAMIKMANKLSKVGSRVYRYVFEHRPSFSHYPDFIHAAQGDEVVFVFGLLEDPSLVSSVSNEELKLSRQMMSAWSNFAKKGNPNPIQSNVNWLPYSSSNAYLEISTQMGPESMKRTSDPQDEFWMTVFEKRD